VVKKNKKIKKYPNYFNPYPSWKDHLYHANQRFFFYPELSATEGSLIDGRARADPY